MCMYNVAIQCSWHIQANMTNCYTALYMYMCTPTYMYIHVHVCTYALPQHEWPDSSKILFLDRFGFWPSKLASPSSELCNIF